MDHNTKMVFIKDIALVKKESDIYLHKERIENQIEELKNVVSNETSLQRLKAISSNIKKLCSGSKSLSEEGKARDRAYQKRRYAEKKEIILEGQRKQRRELRELRESVRESGDISIVSSSS